MAMSSCSRSLPLSPGTFDPGNVAKTRSEASFVIRNNVDESGNAGKRSCSVGPKPNSLSTTAGRREAIGIGLGVVQQIVAWQFPWQPQIAGAAETAPCELTVAPSGLAYCDKVVGTGPEAVKGQLIKAHYVGKLENGKVFDSSYSRGKPLTFKIGVGEEGNGF
ncbi:hypothetical protein BT93_F2301 [Corymbia citriodora subsp. variegata]|nr:hypothetical protein BT93_F2301 [Corymbia citriodora subsp. variegata]